jgi:integrator complex subunit 6
MTIIVFLVDTSASMQQRSWVSGRSTFLDIAKGAVEFFVKLRQKSPESRGDRYMLLTFEEYPKNIKAGWKENLQTFMSELKNLEASGMTTMGSALKQVFDILNINRMQTGIDMYGQGRYPFYLEPAVILVISDGGKLTTLGSVQSELNLPMHSSVPGSELTREPFRWDQRLYALVLRMAGTPPLSQETGHVASDFSSIDAMCEVTGGRSYAVTSQRMLHQCIDSLVQKLQSGVVIHFEKIGPDPPALLVKEDSSENLDDSSLSRADTLILDDNGDISPKFLDKNSAEGSESRPQTPNPVLAASNVAWHNCRRLIYVPRSAQKGFAVGFWPLSEAFWPDVSAPALPQRSAHPNIKFTCLNQEPMIIDNLPFDKYELEPSPLTLYILARKLPNVCWQVFIQGSSRSSSVTDMPNHGAPFGYLKANTKLLAVNLFVLPYNYPVLLPLLDDLFKLHRLRPTSEWRAQFQNYLKTMPAYYAAPLRRVLTRMGAGNLANSLIPEAMDNCLSYSVLNYLKRLKNQAKLEFDKQSINIHPNNGPKGSRSTDGIKVLPRSPLKRDLLMNHLIKDKFASVREQITDFPGFQFNIKDQLPPSNGFRNPYDTDRKNLLDQVCAAILVQTFILQTFDIFCLKESIF